MLCNLHKNNINIIQKHFQKQFLYLESDITIISKLPTVLSDLLGKYDKYDKYEHCPQLRRKHQTMKNFFNFLKVKYLSDNEF